MGITRLAASFAKLGEFLSAKVLPHVGKWLGYTVEGQVVTQGLGRALAMIALRFAGVVGIVVSLLQYAGRLDDVWNAIKDAARTMFEYIQPAVMNLKESFERLIGSLTGGGSFGDVLKFLGNLIADVLIPAIKVLAHMIGFSLGAALEAISFSMDYLGGLIKGTIALVKAFGRIFVDVFNFVKDFVGGWVDFFDDLIHLRFGQAWMDLNHILTSPFRAAWAVIKDIWSGVSGFFGGVADGLANAFDGVVDFLSKPFDTAWEIIKDGVNWLIENVINRIPGVEIDTIQATSPAEGGKAKSTRQLKRRQRHGPLMGGGYARGGRVGLAEGGSPSPISAGKKILDVAGGLIDKVTGFDFGLPDWLTGTADWIKDKVIDFIKNKGKGVAETAKDIALGPIGLAAGLLADGGRIFGPAGLDVIPAWVTKDEFVVTPHGESVLEKVTGMRGILNWLAGVQRPATGFAGGGRTGGGAAPKGGSGGEVATGISGEALDQLVSLIQAFGGKAVDSWNQTWKQIEKIADSTLDESLKKTDKSLDKMREVANQRMRQFARAIRESMNNATKVIGDGMEFIVSTTNKALDVFGIKGTTLTLDKPESKGGGSNRAATGGWIGNAGERGRDRVPMWLGRGEAVLNWAHQKVVDPALRAVYGYGLNDMFGRTSAYHAGGPGGIGMASGGMVDLPTDPGSETVASSVANRVSSWITRYKANITAGYDPGGGHVSPGHNVTGTATDLVPLAGWGGPSQTLFERGLAALTSAGYTVGYDGRFGTQAWDGHGPPASAGGNAHAHVEWGSADAAIRGAFAAIQKVRELTVQGEAGALRSLAQAALDKARAAANKYIDSKSLISGDTGFSTGNYNGPLDRVFPSFMVGSQAGQPQLSSGQIIGLAQRAGGIFAQMAKHVDEIAQGESTRYPGIISTDGGFGLLQMTPRVQSESTVALWKSIGSYFNPWDNIRMGKWLAEQSVKAGAAWHAPWFGTQFLTAARGGLVGLMEGLGIPQFASGGVIGGPSQLGAPQPIIAHAGEWVLNQRQQGRIASMLGTTVGKLRDLLGFAGGPSAFQDGGEVRENQWLPHFFEVFAEHFGRAIRNLLGGDPSMSFKQYGGFAPILGDLRLGIQQFVASVAELGKVSKDFTQDIKRGRPERDRAGGGNAERSATRRALDLMSGAEKFIGEGMSLFRAADDKLVEAMTKFFDGIAGEGGILDQLAEGFDNMTTVMTTRLNKAIVEVDKHGKVIGRALNPGQVLEHELNDLRRQLKYLMGEKGVLAKTIEQAKKALKRAEHVSDQEAVDAAMDELEKARKDGNKKAIKEAEKAVQAAKKRGNQDAIDLANTTLQNLLDRQRDLNSQIGAAQVAVLDKMEERQQFLVDKINEHADREMSGWNRRTGQFGIDIRRRIAEAMGFVGKLPNLADKSIEVMREQQEDLKKVLRIADKRGNRELVRDLEGQIADLEASIAEAVAQKIADAQSEIERQAGRRQVTVDFMNTMADVQSGFGNVEGAEQMRRAALVQQRSNLERQAGQMRELLADAVAQGMGVGVTGPLEDSITELMGQIEENTLAQYENTIAIRQASIDAITERQGFLGGVGDSLKGIIETMGKITGQVNLPMIVSIVQGAIAQLTETGKNLRTQMERFVGENMGALPGGAQNILNTLQGLHGTEFVTAVTGLNLNEIIDSLGGPQSPLAQQFEALLQAIIDNEAALQANTEELANLQQQNKIQQFTSTAWQWFRQAIFTGMGGLMPEYAAGTPYYSADTGGLMTSDGLVEAHAGELIVPRRFLNGLGTLASAAELHGSGVLMAGSQNLDFATRRAATMQAEAAATYGGRNNGDEYRKLREALLKSSQHIEVHGVPTDDATATASRIAFEAKIPRT